MNLGEGPMADSRSQYFNYCMSQMPNQQNPFEMNGNLNENIYETPNFYGNSNIPDVNYGNTNNNYDLSQINSNFQMGSQMDQMSWNQNFQNTPYGNTMSSYGMGQMNSYNQGLGRMGNYNNMGGNLGGYMNNLNYYPQMSMMHPNMNLNLNLYNNQNYSLNVYNTGMPSQRMNPYSNFMFQGSSMPVQQQPPQQYFPNSKPINSSTNLYSLYNNNALLDSLRFNQMELSDHMKKNFAKFFVIKSTDEDNIHKSIKYQIWSSTSKGNTKLNKIYRESEGKYPIYLLFR